MAKMGKTNVEYVEIPSDYGHDAFLVEIDKIENYVRGVL
jgi:homoserine O-acetyltransferase